MAPTEPLAYGESTGDGRERDPESEQTMSRAGLDAALAKLRADGAPEPVVATFAGYYGQLESGATGLIREADIEPLLDPPRHTEVEIDPQTAAAALDRTVIIKLNGGLGTSMGMDRAKSLVPVRDGRTFLDLVVAQVQHARREHTARLPLLLLDSFRTRDDTLAALAAYPQMAVGDLPLDVLQSREPKLLERDLTPVSWPADPELEWCPPGHGDLYPTLLGSGVLERLLAAGFRYASASNADNLGAAPDARLAGWFAASGAPYAAEVCRRTSADRKGGHLAIRRSDGRVILRDTAQTAPEELPFFTDEQRHPFFHTNNVWLDLEALLEALREGGGRLGLPLIRNVKPVDPRDPSSPRVVQIESAMGAAIEAFDGAAPIAVERRRFLPVKTTSDLLLVRSDVYELGQDAVPRLTVESPPTVALDERFYARIDDFDARFAHGIPSLRAATSLTVEGDWSFGAGVRVRGAVSLEDSGGVRQVADGAVLESAADPGPSS